MTKPIQVLGIDFTSVPSPRKPITCLRASFDGAALCFEELFHWSSFDQFEAALEMPGRWVAGIGFPFGQARRFVENIGWPKNWADYVGIVSAIDRNEFRKLLGDYKEQRAPGDKHHKRTCDTLSRSQSPQTLYGAPVALMFFEGAPRLLRAGIHLPFNHDGDKDRIVLESYPGVAARTVIGDRSYKNDAKKKQTIDQYLARQAIWERITGGAGRTIYGFRVDAPANLIEDPGADDLDALLCAVQAAWGWMQRDRNYGAPHKLDRIEGWISDPAISNFSQTTSGRKK